MKPVEGEVQSDNVSVNTTLCFDNIVVFPLVFFQSAYEHHKEVRAAQGCKIAAKDLEKALAGLPLYVAQQADEVEVHRVRC